MNLKDELGKLLFFFERGRKTYSAYLESGSIYLYAKILKRNNDSILELLSAVYIYCPKELQEDILDLIHHIDVWSSHWLCLERELKPKPEDKFIFQNGVKYPKASESKIVSFYEGFS